MHDVDQRARAIAHLADDERRDPVELHDVDVGTGAAEALGRPVRGAAQLGQVAALGRDPQELDQLLDPAGDALVDEAVERREGGRGLGGGDGAGARAVAGHSRLRGRSRNGSSTTRAVTRPRRPSTVHSTWSFVPTRS